jgi:choline monooxygenase
MPRRNGVLADYLTSEDLARLAQPTCQATGLPARMYTDPEVARLENERLFARTWTFAGYAHEIARPGEAQPVVVAGAPLLFVHDRAGLIRGFHNYCPHRGNLVLSEPKPAGALLRCRYHGWTYGVNRGDPDGLDKSCLGLRPVRTARWHDWLFVNLDGDAPPFEDHVRPFAAYVAEYDLDCLVHGETVPFEIKANWKLVEENFLEAWHLAHVHPRLHSYAPFHEHQLISDGACLGTIIDVGLPVDWADPPLPRFPGLAPGNRTAKNLALFPNFKLVIGPDHCASMCEFPVDVGLSRQRWDFYFVGGEALDPRFDKTRREIVDFFSDTNREDVSILESMQVGRASPVADGGVFSGLWEPVLHDFQRLVIRSLE